MKTVISFTALLFICLAPHLNAQDLQVIKDSQAAQYIGKNVEVRGLVIAVYTSENGNIFLNFGAKYPNQTFIGYIPARSELADDRWTVTLQGKVIGVTGTVEMYHGKAQIKILSRSQILSESTNGITFNVRQENSASQSYRLEVPPNVPVAKPDTPKISQDLAVLAAVAWAGGLETNNGLTTLGGGKPGGFYNATHIKVDSAQQQTSGPVTYYLVQMEGNIGQIPQIFYAAVLDDGRIVEPTAIGRGPAPQKTTTRGDTKR